MISQSSTYYELMLCWQGHWEMELSECKTILYNSLYICALVYAKYWPSKLQIWPRVGPKIEMSARTERSVCLYYFLVFISFSCFFSFLFHHDTLNVHCYFLSRMFVCNLIIPRPSGCSFYLMPVCVSLPLCSEKK